MEKPVSDVVIAILIGVIVAAVIFALQAQWKATQPVLIAAELPVQKRSLEEHAQTAGRQVAECTAGAHLIAAAPPSFQPALQGLAGVLISATQSFAAEYVQAAHTNDCGGEGISAAPYIKNAARHAHVQLTAASDACKQVVVAATPQELRETVDQAFSAAEAGAKKTAVAFLCGVARIEATTDVDVPEQGASALIEELGNSANVQIVSSSAVRTATETKLPDNVATVLAWGHGAVTYFSSFATATKQRLLDATPADARSSVAHALDKIGVGAKDLGVGVVIGAVQHAVASTGTPLSTAAASTGVPSGAIPSAPATAVSTPGQASEAQGIGRLLGQLIVSVAAQAAGGGACAVCGSGLANMQAVGARLEQAIKANKVAVTTVSSPACVACHAVTCAACVDTVGVCRRCQCAPVNTI